MTDWLMVIITTVYVIATIAICIANFKSAKATREQLDESKRQFIINQRISASRERCKVMPYLMLSVKAKNKDTNLRFILTFVNYGDGSVKDFIYDYFEDECQLVIYHNDDYNVLIASSMSTRYIRKEQSTEFEIVIKNNDQTIPNVMVPFKVFYKDILDNHYEQAFSFRYALESICRVESNPPKLIDSN